jgi:hypothetical protein
MWSTPRSSDAEKGGPNMSFGAGGTPLPAQACQFIRPDQKTETGGPKSSASRPQLNPLFVEWLMGWPLGWTACGRAATESFRLWLHLHGGTLLRA